MPINSEQTKKRNRQMAILLVAAVVCALLIFGGGAYLFTRIFTGHVKSVDEYETMQLSSANYSDTLELSGTIQSATSNTITSKVDGTVSVLSVAEGDKVKKGDKLFILENDTITEAVSTTLNSYTDAQDDEASAKTNLENAQAKVKTAQQSLSKAQSRLENAQKNAEAKQEEDPEYEFDSTPYDNAVELAQQGLENAQSSQELMQSAYDKAQSSTKSAQKAYNKAVKDENNLTVTAPADGTVNDLNIQVGSNSVEFNANGGAMKIVDMDTVTCVAQVPESQVGNITQGQTATVTADSVDGSFSAIVSRVSDTPSKSKSKSSTDAASTEGDASSDSASDEAAQTMYDVVLTLDKSSKKLKVGLSATASITIQDFGIVYYVPSSAVGNGNSGAYVESVSDEKTTKQYSVTQIATADDGQLVIQGASLVPGMTIRTDLSQS